MRFLFSIAMFFLTQNSFAKSPYADPYYSPVFVLDLVSEQIQMAPGSENQIPSIKVTKVELGSQLWPDWHPSSKRAIRVFAQASDGKALPVIIFTIEETQRETSPVANQEVETWTSYLDEAKTTKEMVATVTSTYEADHSLIEATVSLVSRDFGFHAVKFHDPALTISP